MDLFAKTEGEHNYTIAKEKGIYPYFHELRSGQDTVVDMEGIKPQSKRSETINTQKVIHNWNTQKNE